MFSNKNLSTFMCYLKKIGFDRFKIFEKSCYIFVRIFMISIFVI